MKLDHYAGPCPGKGRHRWGEEGQGQGGWPRPWTETPCQRCGRIKVIEYTHKGNHVKGYRDSPAGPGA